MGKSRPPWEDRTTALIDEIGAVNRVLWRSQAQQAALMVEFCDARKAADKQLIAESSGRPDPMFKAGEFAAGEVSLAVKTSKYTTQRTIAMTRRVQAEAPDVWDAWEHGDIDHDKVVRINRALRRLVHDGSKALLNTLVVPVAIEKTPEILGRWLNQFIAEVEPDETDERLHRSFDDRYVTVRPDLDGISVLHAASPLSTPSRSIRCSTRSPPSPNPTTTAPSNNAAPTPWSTCSAGESATAGTPTSTPTATPTTTSTTNHPRSRRARPVRRNSPRRAARPVTMPSADTANPPRRQRERSRPGPWRRRHRGEQHHAEAGTRRGSLRPALTRKRPASAAGEPATAATAPNVRRSRPATASRVTDPGAESNGNGDVPRRAPTGSPTTPNRRDAPCTLNRTGPARTGTRTTGSCLRRPSGPIRMTRHPHPTRPAAPVARPDTDVGRPTPGPSRALNHPVRNRSTAPTRGHHRRRHHRELAVRILEHARPTHRPVVPGPRRHDPRPGPATRHPVLPAAHRRRRKTARRHRTGPIPVPETRPGRHIPRRHLRPTQLPPPRRPLRPGPPDPSPGGPDHRRNLGPNCRNDHRGKTHAGHRTTRHDDVTEWTTPTGHTYPTHDQPFPVDQWPETG